MASTVSYILNLGQLTFSAYNLWLASISITNLQKYEEKSKKAAEYSNTAAHELQKTRTTQISSALAVNKPAPELSHITSNGRRS